MKRAVIVDIDGTVALMGKDADGKPLPGRRGPYDWDRVGEDDPNQPVIDLVNNLDNDVWIVYASGRDESCREATREWMERVQLTLGDALHMRPHKDNRADVDIKREIYETHIKGVWDVVAVFDDRDNVVAMWRGLGLTCLQVAPGAF